MTAEKTHRRWYVIDRRTNRAESGPFVRHSDAAAARRRIGPSRRYAVVRA